MKHFFRMPIRFIFIPSVIFFLVISTGCHKELIEKPDQILNENGTVIRKSPIWKKSLSDKGLLIGSFIGPILYDGIVATPGIGSSNEDWFLVGLDIETGEEVWRWNDFFTPDFWYTDIRLGQSGQYYVQKVYESHNNSGSALYCIDLLTGTTKWKDIRGRPVGGISPVLGDDYFFSLYDKTGDNYEAIETIYSGDVKTGEYDSLTVPAISPTFIGYNNEYGIITQLLPFVGNNGHKYLLVPFNEFQIEEGPSYSWTYGHVYLGLYDITSSSYVYDKALITKNSISQGPSIIFDDKIVIQNTDYAMVGIDLYTGEVLWKKSYDQGIFSYIIAGSVLVTAQYIGADTFAYGLDPMTGRQLWRIPSGGGASELRELNGVVYWKDRGDGRLWAVDAYTGELIWHLEDPDKEQNSWWKSDGVAVLPGINGEKGRIFASSHLRMYCYEAAR